MVVTAAPRNRVLEQVIRQSEPMFPDQAVRELLANAMIHQDLTVGGQYLTVEMYADRLVFTNPGTPRIPTDRFIDYNQSRNEDLAELMRQLNICEEKGSGVDKVVTAAEVRQLPAPRFESDDHRTISTLFAHREFSSMSRTDRIRACYQHCALKYVMNERMTNQSLRARFGLPDSANTTASNVISQTREAGLISAETSERSSTRFASYVPFWAAPRG
jgi:ATP-dependent DNA helicase RecG